MLLALPADETTAELLVRKATDKWQSPVQAHAAIAQLLLGTSSRNHDSLLEHCSISSDSFGSLPVFDAAGQLVKYEVCLSPSLVLWQVSRPAVAVNADLPFEGGHAFKMLIHPT